MSASIQNITQQINVIYKKYMREVSNETESIDMEIEQLTQRKEFLVQRKRELGQLREKVLSLSEEMDEMEARYRANRERQEQLQLEIEELEALLAAKRKEAAELNESLEEAGPLRRAKYEEISALISQFSNELANKPIPDRLDRPEQSNVLSSSDPSTAVLTAEPEIEPEIELEDLDDGLPEISVLDGPDAPDDLVGKTLLEEETALSTEGNEPKEPVEEDEVEDIDLDAILAELDSPADESKADEEVESHDGLSLVEELSTILDGDKEVNGKQRTAVFKEEIADLELDDLDLGDLELDEEEELEEGDKDLDQDALEEILSALQSDEK